MGIADDFLNDKSDGTLDRFLEGTQVEKSGIARRHLADPAISLLKGAIGVPEAAIGLADLVSGGHAGKAAQNIGFDTKKAKGILDEFLTPEQHTANRAVDEAEGFLPTISAAVQNPSTIGNVVLESFPSTLSGGMVARGLMKAAPKLAPAVAVGAGEGVVAGGMGAEQVRQSTDDGLLTGKQAGLSALSGALTGGIGVAGNKLAQRFGIVNPDMFLAGVKVGPHSDKGLLKRVAAGIMTEGAFEELPQSAQEQIMQNIALEKTWNEGVPEAAAMGLLAGGVMGGGFAAINRHRDEPQSDQLPQDESGNVAGALPHYQNSTMAVFPDGSTGTQEQFDEYLSSLPESERAAARAKMMGMGQQDSPIAPSVPGALPNMGEDPLTVFPDGSVGSRADADAFISSLPENERPAMRAKLMGMGQEDAIQEALNEAAIGNSQTAAEDLIKRSIVDMANGTNTIAPAAPAAPIAQEREKPASKPSGAETEVQAPKAKPVSPVTKIASIAQQSGEKVDSSDVALLQAISRQESVDQKAKQGLIDRKLVKELTTGKVVLLPQGRRAIAENGGNNVDDQKSISATNEAGQETKEEVTGNVATKGVPSLQPVLSSIAKRKQMAGWADTDIKDQVARAVGIMRGDRNVAAGDVKYFDSNAKRLEGKGKAEKTDKYDDTAKFFRDISGAVKSHLAVPVMQEAMEPVQSIKAPTDKQVAQRAKLKKQARERRYVNSEDTMNQAIIKLGGIHDSLRQDLTGDTKGNARLPFVGSLFGKKGSQDLSDMANQLAQHGFFTKEEVNSVDGGAALLAERLLSEFNGAEAHRSFGADLDAEYNKELEDRIFQLEQQARDEAESRGMEFDGIVKPEDLEINDEQPTPENLVDVELLAKAIAIDPVMADKIVTEHESDHAGLMNAVEKFIKDSENEGIKIDENSKASLEENASVQDNASEEDIFGLESQDEKDLAAAAAEKEKSDKEAKKKSDTEEKARKQAAEKKEIDQRGKSAADDFVLGGNAMDELAGQKDIFAQPAQSPKSKKSFTYKIKPEENGFVLESDDGGGIVLRSKPIGPSTLDRTPARIFQTEEDAKNYAESKGMELAQPAQKIATTEPSITRRAGPDGDRQFVARAFVVDGNVPVKGVGNTEAEALTDLDKDVDRLTQKRKLHDPKDSAKEKAKQDLSDALADLADIFGKGGKAMLLPEQEQKLMPVMARVMDAALRMGYYKFKDAARFVLKTIREKVGADVADQLTIDHLQGAYISMAGKYKEEGADSKKDVINIESLDEINSEEENKISAEKNDIKESKDEQASSTGTGGDQSLAGIPAKDVRGNEGERKAASGGDGSGGKNPGRASDPDRARVSARGSVDSGSGELFVSSGGNARGNAGKPGIQGGAKSADGVKQDAAKKVVAGDYRITEATRLGEGGAKTKFSGNVAAIRLMKELRDSGRKATPEEQDILARYVGWGGISQAFDSKNADWSKQHAELKEILTPEEWDTAVESTQYAHYTSENVIRAMYGAAQHLGFGGGNILEPGSGVGNFIGLMPDSIRNKTRFTGVERESIAGGIAKLLYPNQNIQQVDFTQFNAQDGHFDFIIGNPPFSSTPLTDLSGRKHLSGLSIHNYFFAKSIDMLREGGILMQVVTSSFMDAGRDRSRTYISNHAKLVGAIRLPNSAFMGNAGTDVTTDIIFLQKLPESQWNSKAAKDDAQRWLLVGGVPDPKGGESIPLNNYFVAHPEMMLGRMERVGGRYNKDMPGLVAHEGDMGALLAKTIKNLPANIYTDSASKNTAAMDSALTEKMSGLDVEVNGYFVRDGKLYQRVSDVAGEQAASPLTPNTMLTEKTKLGEVKHARLIKMSELRNTVRQLISAERAGDKRMNTLRAQLNEQYDNFIKDGLIHDRSSVQLFGDDPDYPLLASLERNYDAGISKAAAQKQGIKQVKSSAKKTDIFTKSVVSVRKAVTSASSPVDALMVSIAEHGRIDAPFIGKLLGKDGEEVLDELAKGENPELFLDPAGDGYVLRDEYLSGNVRKKLQQAEAAGMESNARALRKVVPEDIPSHEIVGRIAAPWIPTETYESFVKHLLGDQTKVKIRFVKALSSFNITVGETSEVADTNTYGIPEKPATEIIDALLNNRQIQVRSKPDMDGKTVLLKDKTDEANDKAAIIREKFSDWLMNDPVRSEKLGRLYNDAVNNYVVRKYNGEMLTFPGKVPDSIIKLRRHQRDAIARGLQDGRVLLDHVVGSGKTFTVIALAQELKRTGLAKKNMIVVPNHLVKQWAADYYRLYPGAKILAATKKDFERTNRRAFLARAATGNWDAIVIAHSSFGFIKPDPVFEEGFNRERISEIISAIEEMKDEKDQASKRTTKMLAKMKENLEQKLKSLRDKPMDALLDLGQLGVDSVFVDEAHMFKNLMYTTKMSNVRGLGQPQGSMRAYDMMIKTRQIMDANGGKRGVVFATGTPISNSMGEMYHMLRYLYPDGLAEMGMETFDAWANTFASVEQVWMQSLSGTGYKASNRMSKFVNAADLLKMYNQIADTVTQKDVQAAYREENNGKEFPLPKLKNGKRTPVSLKLTPAVRSYMGEIEGRAKAVEKRTGPPQKGDDNILSIMTDARKAAMDIRLVKHKIVERDPAGRIAMAGAEVVERYRKYQDVRGTQLIFSDMGTPLKSAKKEMAEYQELQDAIAPLNDEELVARADLGDESAMKKIADAEKAQEKLAGMGSDWLDAIKAAMRGFSIYDDMKAYLMENGVPENEIAFIHSYNTDDQKAALFAAVNAGKIRVLLGSTAKMGAGTNVQERLVAIHHIDVPWKPSDIEQREGRIIRQGNKLMDEIGKDFEIEINAYATQDTLDLFMWQIQESKLAMINQLREGNVGREFDNAFEEMQLSAGEMQAAATSNPFLLEEIQLKEKIKKLERKQKSHVAQKNDLINREKKAKQQIEELPAKIKRLEKLAKAGRAYHDANDNREINIEIDGEKYTDERSAGDYINGLESNSTEKPGKDGKTTGLLVPVNINGKDYHSITAAGAAFRDIVGDKARISFERDGDTLIRRADIRKATAADFTRAMETDATVEMGKMGDFTVSVSGEHGSRGIEGYVELKLSDGTDGGGRFFGRYKDLTEANEKSADWISAANGHIGYDLTLKYAEMDLDDAKKVIKDLQGAEKKAEWDGGQELEDARNRHRAVLKSIAEFVPPNDDDPAPKTSRKDEKTVAGMTVADVMKAIDKLQGAGLKRILVAATASDLPESARKRSSDIGGGVRGFYIPATDEVWLIADQIENANEAVFVALHEARHRGLEKTFGKELPAVLRQIWATNPKVRREVAAMQKEFPDMGRDEAIEEVLADMSVAGSAKSLKGWGKLVALINNWLSKLGIGLTFTDEMVETLVAGAAYEGMQDGVTKQTDTPAFKKWFGDSKVVDEDGKPLVVYHGTVGDFSQFGQGEGGGMWFASTHGIANRHASRVIDGENGNVMPVYLSMQNPIVIDAGKGNRDISKAINDAYRNGHDGVIAKGIGDLGEEGDVYFVLEPEQIKSAIGNNGNFDGKNPDIRASRKPSPAVSAYREQNRRFREEHITLWTKAKKWLKRQLSPGGLLPTQVFDEKIKRDSEFEVIEFDIKNLVGKLERAIKQDYKLNASELDEKVQRLMSEVMAGNVATDVPKNTKVALIGMRQYIDHLSTKYLEALQGQAEGLVARAEESGDNRLIAEAKERMALYEVIMGNVGQYVHRSYKAFDDPNWARTVSDEVIDAARNYLIDRNAETMSKADAERRAEVVLNEMLKHGTAYDSMEGFIKESKLGAKDLSILKTRKQIAPEIRALLGEYTDPRVNFAKSATKMGRLIWNEKFLEKVREIGMGNFLFTDATKPPEATAKIAADSSEVFAPLNGLWTFPETDQAFKDALGKEKMEDWYRAVVKMNGVVKFGKTVLSPTTAARNWMSAFFFSIANGHFDMRHMAKSVDGLKEYFTHGGDEAKLNYLRKLKHLGVVYDTPYAGEMMRLLADSGLAENLMMSKGKLKIKGAMEMATKFYQYGDDFWKIIGFENEKRMWMDSGMSEADAEVKAAKRIRDTYPTYSMVGKGIQSLRRFPLAGTFVSFPAEIIRTSYNMVKYLAEDYKDPKTRGMAMRRGAGLAIASSFAYAAQALSLAAAGFDDDDEEAVRLMAAPWQRNANLLFTGYDDEGHIRYMDMSFLDPYNYFKRPIVAVTRGQPFDKAMTDVFEEVLSPFFGTDIAAGTIFEVMANKKSTGAPVYRERDDTINQIADITNHLRKTLQPGILSNMERTYKAIDGDVSPSGKKYDMDDEARAWFGFRMATLDPKVALYYRSFDFKDSKAEAGKHVMSVIRNPKDVDQDDLRSALETTNRLRSTAYKEMSLLIDASIRSGMTRQEVAATLKNSGVSKDDIMALLSGRVVPWKADISSARQSAKKAGGTFGQEGFKRTMERYRDLSAMRSA